MSQHDVGASEANALQETSGAASPSESRMHQAIEGREDRADMISVNVPVINESGNSPFNFIMDPQGLICRTDAVRYGGKKFEEGATLYFKNTYGDYDYSHQSDWIEITNRGAVPVTVTIEAAVQNFSVLELMEECSFDDAETASIYLALVDNSGNEFPLDGNNRVTFDVEIDATEADDSVQTYSFGLTGSCNPDGIWTEIDEPPRIVVTWTIKPLLKKESEILLQIPDYSELESEETASKEEAAIDDQTVETDIPEETSNVETSNEETSNEETSNEETSGEETSNQETSNEEMSDEKKEEEGTQPESQDLAEPEVTQVEDMLLMPEEKGWIEKNSKR